MAQLRFKVGDRVLMVAARENPLNHMESYKAGEHGTVMETVENSSVVRVRLDGFDGKHGNYTVVESLLPLRGRQVQHRLVDASVLHLALDNDPKPNDFIVFQNGPGSEWVGLVKSVQGEKCVVQPYVVDKAEAYGGLGRRPWHPMGGLYNVVKEAARVHVHLMQGYFRSCDVAFLEENQILLETPESPPMASDLCEPVTYAKPLTNTSTSIEESIWLRALFRLCDVSNDGRISSKELVRSCERFPDIVLLFGLQEHLQNNGGQGLEAFFKSVAGRDDQISYTELCDFYENRLKSSGMKAGAAGHDVTHQDEDTRLKEIFEIAKKDYGGEFPEATLSDLKQACQSCGDCMVFFRCRPQIRRAALMGCAQCLIAQMFLHISGGDGEISFADFANFATERHAQASDQGNAAMEQIWLNSILQKCGGGSELTCGDGITSFMWADACQGSLESVIQFGIQWGLSVKTIEHTTRDALGTFLETYDDQPDKSSVKVDWMRVYSHYARKVCSVA